MVTRVDNDVWGWHVIVWGGGEVWLGLCSPWVGGEGWLCFGIWLECEFTCVR